MFYCKQKTAYEMRISDWSSDVCSSDRRAVDCVALAARVGETTFVQRRARAWIDLNRAEHERDPRVDDGVAAARQPFQSAKLRSGLGLVPRRAARSGDLWRSEERRVGKEGDLTCTTRWSPYH